MYQLFVSVFSTLGMLCTLNPSNMDRCYLNPPLLAEKESEAQIRALLPTWSGPTQHPKLLAAACLGTWLAGPGPAGTGALMPCVCAPGGLGALWLQTSLGPLMDHSQSFSRNLL